MKPTGEVGVGCHCAVLGRRARDGHIQIVIKMAGLVWSLLLPEGNSLEKRSVGRTLGDRAQRQREC